MTRARFLSDYTRNPLNFLPSFWGDKWMRADKTTRPSVIRAAHQELARRRANGADIEGYIAP